MHWKHAQVLFSLSLGIHSTTVDRRVCSVGRYVVVQGLKKNGELIRNGYIKSESSEVVVGVTG